MIFSIVLKLDVGKNRSLYQKTEVLPFTPRVQCTYHFQLIVGIRSLSYIKQEDHHDPHNVKIQLC